MWTPELNTLSPHHFSAAGSSPDRTNRRRSSMRRAAAFVAAGLVAALCVLAVVHQDSDEVSRVSLASLATTHTPLTATHKTIHRGSSTIPRLHAKLGCAAD